MLAGFLDTFGLDQAWSGSGRHRKSPMPLRLALLGKRAI
jgi:hypothetical protein